MSDRTTQLDQGFDPINPHALPVGILDTANIRINPATEEKQDTLISNQTSGVQKTKVIDSAGTVQDWVKPEGQESSANSMGMVLSIEQEAILSALLTTTIFTGRIGEVQATPTTNTLLARLKDLLTGIVLATGSNLLGDVALQPRATATGWDTVNFTSSDGATALTNSAQAIKATAGKFGGYYYYNPNTVACWIQVYNVAYGSVTVGTTNPKLTFCIPAGSAANVEFAHGIAFDTAISIAAVMTTAGGTTAPTTALEVMVYYK